jgi:hypothetical protein
MGGAVFQSISNLLDFGALDRVSRASHYASEKIFKKFLEFLGDDTPGDMVAGGARLNP